MCKPLAKQHSTALGTAAPLCSGALAAKGLCPGAPPALQCFLHFLAASLPLLMIKQILGVPLFKAVVKVAALSCFLQRNRWSLDLRHSDWAGCKFSLGSFEIVIFHCRISDYIVLPFSAFPAGIRTFLPSHESATLLLWGCKEGMGAGCWQWWNFSKGLLEDPVWTEFQKENVQWNQFACWEV